ncbi:CIC11C00000002941 [Sungouiella intermedia]|uniref:CIC11C00000002941 n=1 Tax=Sungouiella intermedia TaxID=45354 RepID=A0A1L0BKG2_9ASCO|nr:CIC11C00000002941 [[Candida] intermedia]
MFLSRTFAKPQFARCFSGSAARFVAVGDKIPSATLFEGSPGNDVNLAEDAASGKAVVIGVPGAFSPACSASHVPGYLKKLREFNDKGYTSFYVVGVNDAFVMKAWGDSLLGHLTGTNQVRFLADPKGETKRFALLLEDGVVTKTFIEPDNVSVEVSGADAVLKEA